MSQTPSAYPASSEALRLAALRACSVLDTAAEPEFDALVELAARLLDVPLAAVNLVDEARQFTKAGFGIPNGHELPREQSFCSIAIRTPERELVVADTALDPRFADHPLVREGLRFYAGVPLTTVDGLALGALCVADTRPRELRPDQLATLRVLAASAAAHLEARQRTHEAETAAGELESVLAQAPDAFVAMDDHGRVTRWNAAAERMFGWPRQEAHGRPVADLIVAPQLREAHRRGLARYLATGTSAVLDRPIELPAVRRDGTQLTVELMIAAVTHDGERAFNAFIRDVTARRQAERELRETKALLEGVLEHASPAIYAKDGDGRLLFANPAFERATGVSREDALGRTDHELFGPLADLFRANDLAVLRSGLPITVQEELADRAFESVKFPLRDADGTVNGVAGISTDVTERLRAERLKDQFLALVSHELRTPLTSIAGYLELLVEGAEDRGRPDPEWGFLAVMRRNTRRLERLVGDMLFIAQVQAGQLPLRRETVELGVLATDAIEALRHRAEPRGIDLRLDVSGTAPLSGDSERLGQVLDNLVANAIKFTPDGGSVVVRLAEAGDRVVLEVEDTGVGVPADELPQLFDRFFRSRTAREQHIPGAGLGLGICKAIVDGHDGTIAVDSREGVGTLVRVELPRSAPADGASPLPAAK